MGAWGWGRSPRKNWQWRSAGWVGRRPEWEQGHLLSPNRVEQTEGKWRKGGHEGQGQRDLHSEERTGPQREQDRLHDPHSQLQKVFLETLSIQLHSPEAEAGSPRPTCRNGEPAKHVYCSKIKLLNVCCFYKKEWNTSQESVTQTDEQFKWVQQNIA